MNEIISNKSGLYFSLTDHSNVFGKRKIDIDLILSLCFNISIYNLELHKTAKYGMVEEQGDVPLRFYLTKTSVHKGIKCYLGH